LEDFFTGNQVKPFKKSSGSKKKAKNNQVWSILVQSTVNRFLQYLW